MSRQALVQRTRHILQVISKHGFAHLLKKTHQVFSFHHIFRESRWVRLRLILEELGPTFIKFGQIMSNRVDLFPPELLVELQKLQFNVPPFSEEEARKVLLEEWGHGPEFVFSEWNGEPVAAASISQVHKAKMKNGKLVAVKIQRPDAKKTILDDIALMKRMANIFAALFIREGTIDAQGLIVEFERTILKELDFREELRSLVKFQALFPDKSFLKSPAPVNELSTCRVLVMYYVEGKHPFQPSALEDSDIKPQKFLEGLADSFRIQIFTHGFFHADPHPGNLLIQNNGNVFLLDMGMMGVLYKKQRDILNDLMLAIATGDRVMLVHDIWELCSTEEKAPSAAFENELGRTVEHFLDIPLNQLDLIQLFTQISDLFSKHHLGMPAYYFTLIKTLVGLDGLARIFFPEFQLIEWLSKSLYHNFFGKLDTKELLLQGMGGTYEVLKLLKGLPYDIRAALKTLRAGKIQISLNEKNLENTMRDLGKISNRLSASLIITGLILAGTVLIQSPSQPFFYGIPIFATPLFGGAILMGIWLLWSIWRSKTL